MHSPDDLPFPSYAYVPGRHPHPASDPRGHSFAADRAPSRDFRYGLELFNRGYYWEAHEVWESLWIAAGKRGPLATLLKGLIKLAAAGVKAREGNSRGVERHARRAAELLGLAAERADELDGMFDALDGCDLIRRAKGLAEQPIIDMTPSIGGLPVLGFQIPWTDKSHRPDETDPTP